MTVNILIQIDKLVQLLESPVFTCKRGLRVCLDRNADHSQTSVFNCWNQRNIHTSTNVFTGC